MEILVVIIILLCFVRKVPPNTLIIIDRNSHYHKTKRSGFYFMGTNDKVTTKISLTPSYRTLTDYYETDDGKIIAVTISCFYHAHNLDTVQQSLANVRRSIDDILKSSVYFAVGNFTYSQIMATNRHDFDDRVSDNLVGELESIGVSVSSSRVAIVPNVAYGVRCFKPHVSNGCYSTSGKPLHSHDTAIKTHDIYKDGPIISKK